MLHLRFTISLLFISFALGLISQVKVATYTFSDNLGATLHNTKVSATDFRIAALNANDVLAPTTDNTQQVMSYTTAAAYNPTQSNINIAIALTAANDRLRVSHIELRLRFENVAGNAGIFISKDPTFTSKTKLWERADINVIGTEYYDLCLAIPSDGNSFTQSTADSVFLFIAQENATGGMHIDDLEVYAIVNEARMQVRNITVNANNILKELVDRPTGANACWLLDSDINRPRTVSNEQRYSEMQLGALRFPYGHLANNYLWHTPGEYATVAETGPIPEVASPLVPATWNWAMNLDGRTFADEMSFDEYIAICQRQNIEPLIVVNVQSYKYNNTYVTYDQLKESAVEWVRYANITKGYGIKYWQLGNESEHKNYFTTDEYIALFADFSEAMKEIDPTIKVGTGILSKTAWTNGVLTEAGQWCDWVSTHNYLHGKEEITLGGYRTWYRHTDIETLVGNTVATQNLIANQFPDRTDLEIHITETNVTGGDFPDLDICDTYKALLWFEMNMEQIAQPQVKYVYAWTLHNPFDDAGLGGVESLLENSDANTIRPAGQVIGLVNKYLKNRMLVQKRTYGHVRVYASVDADGKECAVFLMNKSLYDERVKITLNNFENSDAPIRKVTFAGKYPNDTQPTTVVETLDAWPTRQFALPPLSLTVIDVSDEDATDIVIPELEEEADANSMTFDGENIRFVEPIAQDALLYIYAIDGTLVQQAKLTVGTTSHSLLPLPRGVNIATLVSTGKQETIKLISD